MQLVGSIGLADNLKEILTQLDMDDILVFFDAFKIPVPKVLKQSKQISYKTLLIEILVKECTPGPSEAKVSELTLFPTEKDMWAWNPKSSTSLTTRSKVQATFSGLSEMQLFEIDRLLKHEAKEAEKVISAEIENIEPQFDQETGEFKAFKSWSASTALLESFKIKEVKGPRLG